MSRILVLVPNTATSDRRVIRQSHSLKKAGHEVEIVGVATTDKPSTKAITDEQIMVTRVNWRAATYRQIFMSILAKYARFGFGALLVLGLIFWFAILPGYELFKVNFPYQYAILDFKVPTGVVFSLLVTLGVIGLAVLSVIYQITTRKLLGGGAIANLLRAGRVADNYAQMEQGTEDSDPLVFRFFKWVASLSKRDEDMTFKATVQSRIDAMYDYGLEWGPDIVYCHEAATLTVGKRLKKKLNCKLVYDAHEIYDDLANASVVQSETYQEIHRKCFRDVDHFITVNPKILGFYVENYPELKNYTVIPNTVFPDATPKYDGRLHEKADLPLTANVMLYQGGFSPHRGLDKLIDSAVRFPENWNLVMMGWGKLEDELVERSEENKKEMMAEFRAELLKEALASETFLKKLTKLASQPVDEGTVHTLMNAKIRTDAIEELVADKGSEIEIPSGQIVDTLGRQGQVYTVQDYIIKRYIDTNSKLMTASGNSSNDNPIVERLVELENNATAAFAQSELRAYGVAERKQYELGYNQLLAEVNAGIQQKLSKLNKQGFFDKVRFIPGAPHDELVSWSKGATIGVIPYENIGANHWNCSPNKIWEYSNAGTPILASRMLYINEVINEHDIGWTFATDFTPKDIALSVKRLDEQDIKEKVKNCKKFIEVDNYLFYEPKLLGIFEALS